MQVESKRRILLIVQINGNRGAQQEISVSTKVSKEIISTGIPDLGM